MVDKRDQFKLIKRIVIKDIPEFSRVSMQYYFKLTKYGRDPTSIIFAKQDRLIEFDFDIEEVYTIAQFDIPLNRQPEFFLLSND